MSPRILFVSKDEHFPVQIIPCQYEPRIEGIREDFSEKAWKNEWDMIGKYLPEDIPRSKLMSHQPFPYWATVCMEMFLVTQ